MQIPRFYLAIWKEQLETLLVLMENPFHPTAPAVLIGGTLVAFVTGLVLGMTLVVCL